MDIVPVHTDIMINMLKKKSNNIYTFTIPKSQPDQY